MKHGKKFLNMRNRKFMMLTLIGSVGLVIVTAITLALPSILARNSYTDTQKVSDLLRNRRFIVAIEPDEPREGYNKNTFDLKTKEYFGGDVAITDNKVYGLERPAEELYDIYYYNYLTSAIKNVDLTVQDVKENNYSVTLDTSQLVEKKFLKDEFLPRLENAHIKHKVDKIKLTYNKVFLPKKLEFFYPDSQKWKVIRTYSYPYDSKKEFDKALDKYIEYIEYWELPDDAMDD